MSSTGQSPDQEAEPNAPSESQAPPIIDAEASEVRDAPPPEERSADASPPPVAPPRRREVGYVAAGLVAALIAGLVLGYWIYEMATAPNRDAIATLDDRVAALEKRLADNVARSDEMTASVNGLRGELQKLAAQPPRQSDGALGERLTRTEQGVGELRTAIDELRKSMAAQAAPAAASADTKAAVEQLKQQVGAVEQLKQQVGAVEQLKQQVGAVEQLKQQVEAVEAKLAQPPPPSVPPETAQKIEDLDRRLKETEAAVQAPKGPPPPAPAGAAFAALLAKAQSGEPYGPALDQMVGQLPDAPGIEALRAAAADGAPTVDELRTALESITVNLNAPAPERHEGLFGALMNRLTSVVRVRRSGELDWGAAAAQALAALKSGNLNNAVSILAQGTNPPDQIATWLKGARARLQVDEALATLSVAVLRHISGPQT
jgi:hypothetical protein